MAQTYMEMQSHDIPGLYIVRLYKAVIVVTNIVTIRINKTWNKVTYTNAKNTLLNNI